MIKPEKHFVTPCTIPSTGDDKVYERKAAPAVFETQTLDMPCSFAAGIYYNGSSSSFTTNPINLMDNAPLFGYGLLAPDLSSIESWNIDIYAVNFYYNVSINTGFAIQRITQQYPDDKTAEYYYGLLSDSSTYTTTDQVVIASPTTGGTNTGFTNDFVPIFNYWLDTLEFYGLRVCINSSPGSNTLEVTTDTATDTYFQLSYVGPAP